MSLKQQRLEILRREITQISPQAAVENMQSGAALLDVREPGVREQGSPDNALQLSRNFLELVIETSLPDPSQLVMTLCDSGMSSLFAADDLRRLGYTNVVSIEGGFSAWKAAGLPWSAPIALNDEARVRYSRHLQMAEIGESGQVQLLASKVLILGAGGLGSPVALYLAAAGVGTLGIVDNDIVERSNLQRQILHDDAAVGMPKTVSARSRIHGINPGIQVITHAQRLTSENAAAVVSGYDLVIDGSDNLETRYCINDACLQAGLPLIYGAIFRFQGQVSIFNFQTADAGLSACYRCLFKAAENVQPPTCSDAGVLGVLPGVIGTLQATEALKILLKIGEPLAGRLLSYDALEASFKEIRLLPDPACRCRELNAL
ncbi:MAG: molybdopterin-synthase adenylyltransferase MoeB [Xanthomonadales bacterium]|nr:molybdopterin-synthase adenylyltransferase MoeB [Xanthomonadales bacterium]